MNEAAQPTLRDHNFPAVRTAEEGEALEEMINKEIDIPGLTEDEEGYFIHLVISLVIALIYIVIKATM